MTAPDILIFGECQLQDDGRVLRRGAPVALSPKERGVLRVLVEAEGRLVSKDVLISRVWKGEAVGDQSLVRCIHYLRTRLGSLPDGQPYIVTSYGDGYRLTVPVQRIPFALGAAGTSLPSRRLVHAMQTEPRVYEAWLEARALLRQRDQARMRQAIARLEQALDWDPDYVPAMVSLAELYLQLASWGVVPMAAALEQAEPLMAAAEAIDPDVFGVTALRAAVTSAVHWKVTEADALFRIALTQDATDPMLCLFYGRHLFNAARLPDAVRALQAAVGLDPLSPTPYALLAYATWCAGDAATALDILGKADAIDPAALMPRLVRAAVLSHAGDAEAACALTAPLAADTGAGAIVMGTHAYACARAGRVDETRAILAAQEQASPLLPSFFVAPALAIGDVDAAARWLARAHAERCNWLLIMRSDPRVAAHGADPRLARTLDALPRL